MDSFPSYRWARFRQWYRPLEKISPGYSMVLLHPITNRMNCSSTISDGAIKFLGQFNVKQDLQVTHVCSEFSEYFMRAALSPVETYVYLQPQDIEYFADATNKISLAFYYGCYRAEIFVAEIYTCMQGREEEEVIVTTIPKMVLVYCGDSNQKFGIPCLGNFNPGSANSLVFKVIGDSNTEPIFTTERKSNTCYQKKS